MMKSKIRHVALVIDAAMSCDRKVISGIASYVHEVGNWSLYVEENPLQKLPDLQAWRGQGIIANLDDRKVAAAVRGLKIPVVGMGGGFVDLCMVNARIKGVSRGNRASPSIIDYARVNKSYDPAMGIPYFISDNRDVARMAADYLLERGFTRFAYCGFPPTRINGWSHDRAVAFGERIAEAGFSCAVYTGKRVHSRRWVELQRELSQWLTTLETPVALMACNDSRARHVLEACRNIGARVPEEIAVLGVDNDQMICDLTSPPLASVELGMSRLGYRAASLLDRMMSGRKVAAGMFAVPPEHVVTRRSCDILAIEDLDIAVAVRFIREHACDSIKVGDVVEAVQISRSTLERRFKAVVGRNLHAEIRGQRIERVRQLLVTTDLPLKQIAARAGFRYLSHMTSLFRQLTGQTPSEFRRRCRC